MIEQAIRHHDAQDPGNTHTVRTKFVDYDARRNPKTKHYCVCCQKDIAEGQPVRMVFIGEDMHAIYPADLKIYLLNPERSSIDIGPFRMGAKCARKLGMEWTVSP